MASVLVLGIDPHAVPGLGGDAVRAVLDQELARFFEQVVNLVREDAPGAAIAFNTTGANSVEAACRWLLGSD